MMNHGRRTCRSEPICSLTAAGMISEAKRSSSLESGVNEDIMKDEACCVDYTVVYWSERALKKTYYFKDNWLTTVHYGTA